MQMVTMIITLKIMRVRMGSETHSYTVRDQPLVTDSCHNRSPMSDIGDPGMCLSASNHPKRREYACSHVENNTSSAITYALLMHQSQIKLLIFITK